MKSMVIVMALMGCGDDGGQCELVKTVPGNWASLEVCEAQAENQIAALADLGNSNFPVIAASCKVKEPPIQHIAATPVEITPVPPVAQPVEQVKAPQPAASTIGDYVPGYDTAKGAIDWAGETSSDLALGAAGWIKDAVKIGS